MKRFALFWFPLLLSLTGYAQDFNAIASAVRAGNTTEIARYFRGNVEIATRDGENAYSKTQAEGVLRNFFATHIPRSFTIQHQGTSPEGSKYMVGNLVTSTGPFRMYIYTKLINGTPAIQEIKFEEQ